MEYSKIILLLAFATCFVLVANVQPLSAKYHSAKGNSHNYTIGNRVQGDRLVMQKNLTVRAKPLRVQTHRWNFIGNKGLNITQVAAYDQKSDGHGASVNLVNGGIGKSNITLQFISQRGHGIHFTIRVYGK